MPWSKFIPPLFGLILLAQSTSQPETRYVILPVSEWKSVAAYFASNGPNKPTDGWLPSQDDVNGLEASLPQIEKLRPGHPYPEARIEHPERYFRQYVGLVQGGHRRIVVNAFCGPVPNYWQKHVVQISDGGTCVWHALYDPAKHQFLGLSINGLA
jgi:hypothetical protein